MIHGVGKVERHFYIAAQHAAEEGQGSEPEKDGQRYFNSQWKTGSGLCTPVKYVGVPSEVRNDEDNKE